ncbi:MULTISPECIES: carboxymuconolactone decarboxylase family protein [unclassified Haladaptatus]|uniref:carboxymuconolactone decarboxylase family protein n=1 Tax=unclassified Haladaptatus TaxID=2622732 RepID=UPI0023E887FE|nr:MULTISPECIES: carboxymuconolactone decarboxylase family protein [unclassified Haladaptatus]
MPRVPYVDFSDPDPAVDALVEETNLGPLNVFRAIANNPPALATLTKSAGTLWAEAGIDIRAVELVILTVARATDCEYEWHQHVSVALDAGLAEETILAISSGAVAELAPLDAALVDYVTAYVHESVDDAVHDRLREHVDDRTVVGVAMLAGEYFALSRTIAALSVEPEDEFVGWDLANLERPN